MPKKPGKSQVVKLKSKKSKTFYLAGRGRILEPSVQFVKEAWMELNKVTWPNQKETFGATAVVLALVFLVSFYLGLVDIGLTRMMKVDYRVKEGPGPWHKNGM